MKKKLLSVLSIFTALVLAVTPVYADTGVYKDGNGDYGVITDKNSFQVYLADFLGKGSKDDVTDGEMHDYSLMISTLKAGGLNTNAIAGILGNVSHESGGKIFAIEGYYGGKRTKEGKTYAEFEDGGTYDYDSTKPITSKYKNGGEIGGVGHGIVQWSFGRADALSSFAESHPEFGSVTVTHWKISKKTSWEQETCHIPNMAGQVAFMAIELEGDYKAVKDKMQGASSASEAAKIFMDDYEKPAKANLSARQASAEKAVKVIEACTGVVEEAPANNNDPDGVNDSTAILNTMSGYWNEDQLSAYIKLTESNIQEDYLNKATRESLGQNDLYNLAQWKNRVKFSKQEDGFMAYMRILVVGVGIIFTIYIFFLYFAYWFDKLNCIIDLDVLSILTFGRLHVAMDDKEANFSLGRKQDRVTVNHKDMLFICIAGLIFGVLLITGKFYQMVYLLILFIRQRLG